LVAANGRLRRPCAAVADLNSGYGQPEVKCHQCETEASIITVFQKEPLTSATLLQKSMAIASSQIHKQSVAELYVRSGADISSP
jgi:hypothetical protein